MQQLKTFTKDLTPWCEQKLPNIQICLGIDKWLVKIPHMRIHLVPFVRQHIKRQPKYLKHFNIVFWLTQHSLNLPTKCNSNYLWCFFFLMNILWCLYNLSFGLIILESSVLIMGGFIFQKRLGHIHFRFNIKNFACKTKSIGLNLKWYKMRHTYLYVFIYFFFPIECAFISEKLAFRTSIDWLLYLLFLFLMNAGLQNFNFV